MMRRLYCRGKESGFEMGSCVVVVLHNSKGGHKKIHFDQCKQIYTGIGIYNINWICI